MIFDFFWGFHLAITFFVHHKTSVNFFFKGTYKIEVMAYDLRWSAIATHLPKRTDNEIKNYWNTHLKKRLAKMGIDPVTHKPKSDALSSGDGHAKSAASLSHMAQWESARLEAEARLARESRLRAAAAFQPQPPSSSSAPPLPPASTGNKSVAPPAPPPPPPPCLDVLRAWQGVCSAKPTTGNPGGRIDLESPTSTLSFSENVLPIPRGGLLDSNSTVCHQEPGHELKEEQDLEWKGFEKQPLRMLKTKDHRMDSFASFSMDATSTVFGGESSSWLPESSSIGTGSSGGEFGEGFTGMLLDNSDDPNSSDGRGDSDNVEAGSCVEEEGEENKNYWNSILNLVNSASPSSPPPVF